MRPAFLICAGALALAAGSKEAAIRGLGVWLAKQPIPLRKPFDEIEPARLAPYRVVHKGTIEGEVLEELGTHNYLQWELEDTDADASSAVRYCSLFITYYELPDRVPHVPEECITGGAGDTLLSKDNEQLRVDVGDTPMTGLDVNDGIVRLPVRYLTFLHNSQSVWQSDFEYAVLYFFKANSQFASSRGGVRGILAENLFGKYSCFSKVEWRFYGTGPSGLVYGSKDEVLAASAKLMSRVLPLLEAEHWPDWEAANKGQ